MALDETFDVGVDTRTPVDDNDYQVAFHFTGKIAKLTFKVEPEQMTEADRKVMHTNTSLEAKTETSDS
jgi:arylsulfatase